MYFSVRSILDVCGEKSLHNINISLFIKIDQKKICSLIVHYLILDSGAM